MNRGNGRKFEKLISRVLIFSLCFSSVISLQLKNDNIQAKTNSHKTKKEYLVKVDKNQNIKEIGKHNELEVLDVDINDNQYLVIKSDKKFLENMEERYDVTYEEDRVVTASSNKEIVAKDWNYRQIELNRNKSKRNKNKPVKGRNEKVKVAVLDSGIDMYGDIDVSESVNFVEDEQDILPVFQDLTGHGTSIAGIIAANKNDNGITGINPNVELYSVKVFDMNNEAPMSRIIEGINWCVEHNVDIIKMSFGTSRYSEILEEAIRYADKNGILMIAAAGNRGTVDSKDCIDYPAAYEEVLSVGSVA